MSDTTEILNIDYHVRRLVLKALNKHKERIKAADDLGVSYRTLSRYRRRFKVQYADGQYFCHDYKVTN